MSDLNPTSAPFEAASPNDHGVSVSIVNVILIIFSGIVVISRAITRVSITRLTAVDDVAIFVSLVFAIAQCVCIQLARNNGLGKHRHTLSSHDFFEYSRYNYASQLLTIFTLLFAKMAVSRLILTIRPMRVVRFACYAVEGAVALWALTSLFSLAFQCDIPNPWLQESSRCVNLKALYYYIGIVNILTDVALVIIPIFVVHDLQLKTQKKVFVVFLFATRICVVGVVIAQLATLGPFLTSTRTTNGDQTWDNVVPTLLNQIMIFASIVTACVPSLRRVVTELQTRQTGLHVDRALELAYGSGKYGHGTVPNTMKDSADSSGGGDRDHHAETKSSNTQIPYGHNIKGPVGNLASIYAQHDHEKTQSSRPSSQERLRRPDGIHYTQEYSVATVDDETISTPSERRRDDSF